MRWFPLLPAALVMTTVIMPVTFSPPSQAQSQVAETARTTTVFIQAVGRPDVFGSGVIVGRSGNTYTVLVAKHVVVLEETYKVTTNDKSEHTVKQLDRLGSIDIAVVQFESKNNYSVATVGSPAQQLDQLIVSGYPKPTTSVTTIALTMVPATVNTILESKAASEGYALRYSARTHRGMSGGPVFNSSAQLVAIHGRADELGGLGIPLTTFVEQSKSAGLKVRLGGSAPVAVVPSPSPSPPPRPAPSPQGKPVAVAPTNPTPSPPAGTTSAMGGAPPNLSRADVARLQDTKACPSCRLDGANLSYAQLFGANLASASLRNSVMSSSTLTGANLNGANLSGSDLSRADLSGARLQGANLSGANLSGAILNRADLSGAILDGAILDGAQLQGVIGYSGKK
jgi:hypothetical protein